MRVVPRTRDLSIVVVEPRMSRDATAVVLAGSRLPSERRADGQRHHHGRTRQYRTESFHGDFLRTIASALVAQTPLAADSDGSRFEIGGDVSIGTGACELSPCALLDSTRRARQSDW